ncbi:hypothetical protein ACA910_007877 [Epithemia clementina (nom. ined.)]
MFCGQKRIRPPSDKNRLQGKGTTNDRSGEVGVEQCRVKGNKATRGLLKYLSADDSLHSIYGSDSKNISNDKKHKEKLNVTFTTIEIREYARTIGDNPSCTSGPPVAISWEYAPSTTLSLDDYEDGRPPRRTNIEMILPRDLRQRMLRKEWDVTQSQIAAQVRTNIKIKNQRRTTVNNLDKSNKVEEAVESARKFLSAKVFRKGTEKELRALQEQMELAEKARKVAKLYGANTSKTVDESRPELAAVVSADDGTENDGEVNSQ